MNTVIQINLASCIITLDTDAYELLSQYLETLKKYFKLEEGGVETYQDIEARVAEIFLSKLKESRKASVDKIMVEEMIKMIGQPADLGIDEDGRTQEHQTGEKQKSFSSTSHAPKFDPKYWYRSKSNKYFFGVAGGLSEYFSVDPIWLRLAFVISVFLGGLGVLCYIILAVVLPGKLSEEYTYKKLFRLSEQRILGGVCTGVSTYFEVPLYLVRIIFFAPVIFSMIGVLDVLVSGDLAFISILVYTILWSVLPLAKSSSDILKLKGKVVNLQNIQTQVVAQSKKVHSRLDRFFSVIFSIVKGIVLSIGGIVAFILFILAFALVALFIYLQVPIYILIPTLSLWLLVGLLLTLMMPIFIFVIWLVSRIFSFSLPRYLMMVLTVVGFVALSSSITGIIITSEDYVKHQKVLTNITLPEPQYSSYHLVIQQVDQTHFENLSSIFNEEIADEDIDELEKDEFLFNEHTVLIRNISFDIEATEAKNFYIEQTKEARGKTKAMALEHAKNIPQAFTVSHDTIFMDSHQRFDENNKCFFQHQSIVLRVPMGKSVQTGNFVGEVGGLSRKTLYTAAEDGFIEKQSF